MRKTKIPHINKLPITEQGRRCKLDNAPHFSRRVAAFKCALNATAPSLLTFHSFTK
jgi:hypothetical protein